MLLTKTLITIFFMILLIKLIVIYQKIIIFKHMFVQLTFLKFLIKKRERITTKVDRNDIYSNPQNYSPNVLLRPIYQEMILPNVAYIGGGSEISYWLQLKDVFNHLNSNLSNTSFKKFSLDFR